MSSAPFRVAVVGAGGIASRHVGNLIAVPDVALVGVADPVEAAAAVQVARAPGARAFSDWRSMLDELRPDALLICVPPFVHGDPELAAIDLDMPFFVEKPIATDLETAERIGAGVADRGLVTAVGYHWRYLDTTEKVAELLEKCPAQLATGYWWDATPPRDWWVRMATSGGQLVEQATHIFDLARHLIGEAEVVSAVARRTPGRRSSYPALDVPDATAATVRFDSGAIGVFSSTHLLGWPHRIGLDIVSEAMVIELSEFDVMIDVGLGRPRISATVDPFALELADFLAAAQGGANGTRAPYAEALRTQRLTVAATRLADDDGQRERNPGARPREESLGDDAPVTGRR